MPVILLYFPKADDSTFTWAWTSQGDNSGVKDLMEKLQKNLGQDKPVQEGQFIIAGAELLAIGKMIQEARLRDQLKISVKGTSPVPQEHAATQPQESKATPGKTYTDGEVDEIVKRSVMAVKEELAKKGQS